MKAFLGLLAVATIALGHRLPFSIENRIANGLVAIPNEFPFQVGLMMVSTIGAEEREVSSWCGGSLIARDVVLTAAHCLDKARRVTVFLGAHDISKVNEPGRVVIPLDEDSMFINPDYDTRSAENDIALVKLPFKVELSDKIQLINLPRLSEKGRVLAEKMGIISGWGKMGDANGQSPVLRYANRRITKDRNCEFFFFGFKASTQVCVDGRDRVSACPGDSGGPLTITENDGTKTLVGLTSYGRMEGCERGFPTVYTKVSAFLDWIATNADVQLRA